jgi:hypothetical protein
VLEVTNKRQERWIERSNWWTWQLYFLTNNVCKIIIWYRNKSSVCWDIGEERVVSSMACLCFCLLGPHNWPSIRCMHESWCIKFHTLIAFICKGHCTHHIVFYLTMLYHICVMYLSILLMINLCWWMSMNLTDRI